MGVSRQHLSLLLGELAASALALVRWKPNGRFAPWLFRFGVADNPAPEADVVSATDDTSLSRDSKNKMVFSGKIEFWGTSNVYRTPWAEMIKAAKRALPCWNVDTQAIWEAFREFNQTRGNTDVPAGYLLGFMRKWRNAGSSTSRSSAASAIPQQSAAEDELRALIRAAPMKNWQFHASDLRKRIGQEAYDARVRATIARFSCPRFAAALAVHGRAIQTGEISL